MYHTFKTKMEESAEENCSPNRLSRVYKHVTSAMSGFFSHPETVPCEHLPQKYSYIFRRKSRWELIRISAVVCGIEFCYSAETAFVTPVLLSLGLNVKYVSMLWCVSPLLAFIWTPILGSFSDSCRSRFGRRRPFIFILSVGIVIGLILIPYGERLGVLFGDDPLTTVTKRDAKTYNVSENLAIYANNTGHEISKNATLRKIKIKMLSDDKIPISRFINSTLFDVEENTKLSLKSNISYSSEDFDTVNKTFVSDFPKVGARVIGITFTVAGTVFLDFCADVCQSPCRAYLLDITIPKEQAAGLALFSLVSGIGSAVGYGIAAIKWDVSLWGNILEGQVIVSFAIISILYLLFVSTSLYSYPEIPMPLLEDPLIFKEYQEKKRNNETKNHTEMSILPENRSEYSSIKENCIAEVPNIKNIEEGNADTVRGVASQANERKDSTVKEEIFSNQISPKEYLKSILFMPKSIRILCLTIFLCGMGIISYTLFFTDFVGECVYNGHPRAPKGSRSYELYKEGVRFGCWGMAFCSLSCAVYSGFVEELAERFGTKVVFIGGALVYSAGMVIMAVTRNKVVVIALSSTAGIMLATLSTLPYILVAHYHSSQKFKENSKARDGSCVRGVGSDVATVISIIVLSQCIVSFSMGAIAETIGSNIVVVCSAALFSACGAVSATQVMYFDI